MYTVRVCSDVPKKREYKLAEDLVTYAVREVEAILDNILFSAFFHPYNYADHCF